MSTFLTVVLVVLATLALLGLVALFWVRSKIRKGAAHLTVGGLGMAVDALKQHAAKPEHANDQELAALIARAEAAHASSKAALTKGDFAEALKIAMPVLDELSKYKRALNEERARQAAQAAAQNPADVIDLEAHVVEPVLQLPAPTDSQADVQADVPVTPAAAPADSGADSGADSAAQVDTTAGAGDKPDSKK